MRKSYMRPDEMEVVSAFMSESTAQLRRKWTVAAFGMIAALACAAAPMPLVKDGRAIAQIVVPELADVAETFAAEELQKWVGAMTGAYVPLEKPFAAKKGIATVYVGREFAKKRFPKDIKKMGVTDGFAVRSEDKDGVQSVFVFGSTVKGTLHGVYALLERNSDIIWPRPTPQLSVVFSRTSDFSLSDADFIDVPRTKMREWQWNGGPGRGLYDWDKLWAARNRQNLNAEGAAELSSSFRRYGPGHKVKRYVASERNFKEHPEWFPFLDGKRTMDGGMLCLTAYGMLDEYFANLTNDLANAFHGTPPSKIKVEYLNVSLADNGMMCKCEKCMAPFVCENGVVVQPNDPAFRPAQYFTFINKLARMLAKTHPLVSLGTYAYGVSVTPPPFPLESNICVQLCLTALDERSPVFDTERNGGSKWLVDAWTDKCVGIWYRDYTGLSGRTDRAIEYPFAEGARYCMELKHPVTAYSAEHPRDRAGVGANPATEAWDVSGMSTWVMSRLWWNPYEDVDALRRMYIKRTYREAADQMQKYHDAMRDAFRADRMPTMFHVGSPVFLTKRYVVDAGLADKLRGFLNDALTAAKHPVSAELIRRQLAHFERNCAKAAAIPDYAMSVKPLSVGWDAAAESSPFVSAIPVYGRRDNFGATPKFRTTFKMLCDDQALYLRMRCVAPDALTIKGDDDPTHLGGSPFSNDRLEFYVGRADKGVYWHWIMDPGVDGSGKGPVRFTKVNEFVQDFKWTRTVERDAEAWTVTMRIPFSDLELNGRPKELLFNCFRDRKYSSGKKNNFGREKMSTDRSSWTGGGLHDPGGFGKLKFEE